jgi:hypothetical protein
VIYLLDLNFTLVGNSAPRGTRPEPMTTRMKTEIYRQWLVELLRPHRVILITARPDRWKEPTLARISDLTGWQSMDAYFDDGVTRTPPAIKRHILIDLIFPKYGRGEYYAIESNPKTRDVYAALGIPSIWVSKTGKSLQDHRRRFRDLPTAVPQAGLDLGA